MSSQALIVIDMLNDFIDPKGALYCGEVARTVIPAINRLLHRFSDEGHTIIFTCDAHAPDDREFELYAPHAVRGTWGAQIIPEIVPPPGSHIVPKTRFSAFYDTNLERILQESRAEEVWVTGVVTSICVMDTTGDLRNRGYTPIIPVDAVADFDPDSHQFALKRMSRVYGARLVEAGDTL